MKISRLIATTAFALAMTTSVKAANIVETAASTGQFNTLLAAAQAAGLVGALSGHTKLTVFAPTDAAFSKLPAGTVESLLKPENRHKLADILKYHVVAGEVRSTDIPLGVNKVATLKSSGDTTINVARIGKFVSADMASVIQADIETSNGVIHVINRVLLPSS
jgi:uncharacterized surface protein with fasciclin (FAS1) repeats